MINITDKAIEKLKEFLEPWEIIRLAIEGGGCQGFQYRFGVQPDEELLKEDHVVKNSGIRLCVDPISYCYLENVEIDYIDLPFNSKFKINNPDTKSTCGCGSNFS